MVEHDTPPPEPWPDDRIGLAIGNYVVERKLGQGGMGAVYLARHAELPGTFVAVKVLAMDRLTDRTQAIPRIRQEGIAAATAGGHRVARPLDMGCLSDGAPYILMQYVDGRSVASLLRRTGPLSVATALRIAYRVADSMALAHRNGVVHRDLKPSNVMLTAHGDVKILDFGIAQVAGRVDAGPSRRFGTRGYMSPEAELSLETDGRTDVFALGVMLFEMLAGQLPFEDGNHKHGRTTAAPPIASMRPAHLDAAPPSIDALIARALVRDRDGRLSMDQMRRLLLDELRALGGGGPESEVETPISDSAPVIKSPPDAPTLADREAGKVALRPAVKPPDTQATTQPWRDDSADDDDEDDGDDGDPIDETGWLRSISGDVKRRRWAVWLTAVSACVLVIAAMSTGIFRWQKTRTRTPPSSPAPAVTTPPPTTTVTPPARTANPPRAIDEVDTHLGTRQEP